MKKKFYILFSDLKNIEVILNDLVSIFAEKIHYILRVFYHVMWFLESTYSTPSYIDKNIWWISVSNKAIRSIIPFYKENKNDNQYF